MAGSHPVRIKTVVLYNIRRIQPETVEKIANAKDGEWVGVEPDEFSAIQELHIFMPEIAKVKKGK